MRTVDWRTLWEEQAEPGELRRVLCALSVSMGGNGGQKPTNCSPSMERIARRAGMRRDTASKWIREAEQAGWINVGRITGLRNRYYATLPKPLDGSSDEGAEVREQEVATPTPPAAQTADSLTTCPKCGWHQLFEEIEVCEGGCGWKVGDPVPKAASDLAEAERLFSNGPTSDETDKERHGMKDRRRR